MASVPLQAFLFHKIFFTLKNADFIKLKFLWKWEDGRNRSSDNKKTTKSEFFKSFTYHASNWLSGISMCLLLFCLEMVLIQTNEWLKNK